MSDLHPCPACRRHVRIDEAACPFCAAALAPGAPPALPVGRLTRAAVFAAGALAAGAGCGSKQPAAADPIDNTVTTSVDAGAEPIDAAPVETVEPIEPVYPDHDVKMPYGAPPARERIV